MSTIPSTNKWAEMAQRMLENLRCNEARTIEGLADPDEILRVSESDYLVKKTRLIAADVHGNVLECGEATPLLFDELSREPHKIAPPQTLVDQIPAREAGGHGIVRVDKDGTVSFLAVSGVQYTITQNKVLVEDALRFMQNSDTSLSLLLSGNVRGGRNFFVVLGMHQLEVKQVAIHSDSGYVETFDRGIALFTGHDGSMKHATVFYIQDPVTGDVFEWVETKLKHYSNVIKRAEENSRFLNEEVGETVQKFIADAQALAAVPLPEGSVIIDKCISRCIDTYPNIKDKSLKRRNELEMRLLNLFLSPAHAGRRGHNAWALFTAYAHLTSVEMGEARPKPPTRGHGRLPLMIKHQNLVRARQRARELLLELKDRN